VAVEIALILGLTTLNLRGARESVMTLAPIFLVFLLTHALIIGGGLAGRAAAVPALAQSVSEGFAGGVSALGIGSLLLLFVHAYSLGGGTHTRIQAVSHRPAILRAPPGPAAPP